MPGLIHGIGIQQIELVTMGHGASPATDLDTDVRGRVGVMKIFDDALLAANAQASQNVSLRERPPFREG